ncbi:phosphonopyruvate decarboxylase [Segnochrobactrum spirostomi]|uniref:Phosphonopyruvate decarboxylase n=1 Tax=Segnochrobactrum spirostomi TaxID=2608987 RepID=A0A6A7YB36_9HYPH|nr:phosphonopyruvate decarboxylase [Segnochrobactrum spirostomi]MQT14882.1 phosphonopyruvate decarboxylase [Segnochrobactrum spirostomi]
MIDTLRFGDVLRDLGFGVFAGVPCSLLQPLINFASNSLDYVAATNEGEAVAIAFGAELGGCKSAVLLQNSGVTNALAPLTSLTNICEIPITGFVGFRGEPGVPDEIQHRIMGAITAQLLEISGVIVIPLATDLPAAARQLAEGEAHRRAGRSVFYLVSKETFSPLDLAPVPARVYPAGTVTTSPAPPSPLPPRHDVLRVFSAHKRRDTALLATTGMCGRELFTIEDAPNHFYMVGSMGCVSSIALGLALARPDRRIVALDGDGALLMRMGNLATNAFHRPGNLLHVLLDNRSHDSTGGQVTASAAMDWTAIARGAGYPRVIATSDLGEIAAVFDGWLADPDLTFLHIPIAPGSLSPLGRPTVTPAEVARRLRDFLARNFLA